MRAVAWLTAVQDMCQGLGVFTATADGRVHKGEFHHDKKHGWGVMTFYAGEKLEGMWDNNLLNGACIFTDSSGRRFKERWLQGSREGDRVPTGHTGAPHPPPAAPPLTAALADVEMRELLKAQAPVAWKADANFKACYHCNTEFTFTTRVCARRSQRAESHPPGSGTTAATVATCFVTSAPSSASPYHGTRHTSVWN